MALERISDTTREYGKKAPEMPEMMEVRRRKKPKENRNIAAEAAAPIGEPVCLEPGAMEEFFRYLEENRRGDGTLESYRRTLLSLYEYLPEEKTVSRQRLLDWKEEMLSARSTRGFRRLTAFSNTGTAGICRSIPSPRRKTMPCRS